MQKEADENFDDILLDIHESGLQVYPRFMLINEIQKYNKSEYASLGGVSTS